MKSLKFLLIIFIFYNYSGSMEYYLNKKPGSNLFGYDQNNFIELMYHFASRAFYLNTPDEEGKTLLNTAISCQNTTAISVLIMLGANVNLKDKFGQTPLILAVKLGYLDIVKKLVEYYKADVNIADDYDDTPFLWALYLDRIKIADFLLNYSNIHKKNKYNENALIYAIRLGNKKIVKKLINKKIDLEFKDQIGDTPLILACYMGYPDIVKILLENKVNVNAKNNFNQNAFIALCNSFIHNAKIYNFSTNSFCEIAKLLISNKIDLNCVDDFGNTAKGLLENIKESLKF